MTANLKSNNYFIDHSKALQIILSQTETESEFYSESVGVNNCLNRISAENVFSEINVPPFDNSAMDGFAVNSNWLTSQDKPYKVPIRGLIAAGDKPENSGSMDGTTEIMTGAVLPPQFDSVIPVEKTSVKNDNSGNSYLIFDESIAKGQNVRLAGTDYQMGQEVIAKSIKMEPQHIMALATVGVSEMSVFKKIRVALISTGNEITSMDSKSLKTGQIYNSNQPYLQSSLELMDCDNAFQATCSDNANSFIERVNQALEQNVKIIISTGAVSMGKFDFIPKALKSMNATIHFHKVKMRPGKPILFAELPCGTLYFGLPGNPIAAAAGLRFFIHPLLQKLRGQSAEKPIKARLKSEVIKKHGFKTFAKAHVKVNDQAELSVEMLKDQGSYQAKSFSHSNCWMILDESKEHYFPGELVDIVPLQPGKLRLN